MAGGDFPRRMTVVRLRDRRLVIYSAIALDELEMGAIGGFGLPAFLVVPGDLHRMDAKIWKDRYPDLWVVAPTGARAKVEKVVHVDATSVDLGDPNVSLVEVPGTGGHEAALIVKTRMGANLIVNDIIANMPDRRGFGGWLLRLVGFTGNGPRVPRIVKPKSVPGAPPGRSQLQRGASLTPLPPVHRSAGLP